VGYPRGEWLATLREAVLMPLDLGLVFPSLKKDQNVVILLHGLLATAGVFRPMRSALQANGLAVATFSYAPGRTIASIAEKLADVVGRIPKRASVHIVGHSLGGLVARHYVQELGGHARIALTVSLASPFHGAPRARALAWLARDLRPESHVLANLRRCPPHVRVPHVSIIAGRDQMIPPHSARFPGAPAIVLPDRGHNGLLFDPEVVRIILSRVAHARAA
jgi:triacylglycerol lipase